MGFSVNPSGETPIHRPDFPSPSGLPSTPWPGLISALGLELHFANRHWVGLTEERPRARAQERAQAQQTHSESQPGEGRAER